MPAMMLLAIRLFLVFLSAPMTATWSRPGVVDIQFTQDADTRETCILREPQNSQAILVQCWQKPSLPPGRIIIRIGAQAGLDGRYRGQAGDYYIVTQDGRRARRAQLRGVIVLPVLRR
jgi:hypothetical protein